LQFNSIAFLVFFPIVWAAYWLLRSPGQRLPLIALASFFFYGWWDWRFLSLIGLSIAVDYGCGLALGRTDRDARRRLILGLSLGVNLGVLALFKYFDFFAESASDLLGVLGFAADRITLELILPLGISFYTFQTLAYTIDVYRRRVEPCRDPVLFACYVSFFPQLVAGPIERAQRLLPQLAVFQRLAWRPQFDGLALIVQGFFKKLVVADNLSFVVEQVFAGGRAPDSGWLVLFGVWAFALQIYGDFSGYSDIARGLSRCLGIELVENFRAPYFAQNPQDFWRRWHISLSTWLRDYLYISLGGNRRGSARTYANLIATMVLGGLWHGAAWTFVAWGAFHGTLLAVHRAWRSRRETQPPRGKPVQLLQALLMFQFVSLGWLLFRAESISQVGAMLSVMATSWAFDSDAIYMARYLVHFGWAIVLMQGVRFFTDRTPAESGSRSLTAVCAIYMLLHIYEEGVLTRGAQFIYFQF
jgi:D-alanyl-lipoteichoic acid acyltransferase DltB (MBOAT superfamily)